MKTNLKNAFLIVASALGNKLGVKVRVHGGDAYTDGDVINVPAYDGEDPGYLDVAWGYLAHEAAHVRYTDFEEFRRGATTPVRKTVLNILEDVRIERELGRVYPGTRLTIGRTVERLVADGDYAPAQAGSPPAQVLLDFLLFHLRRSVLGQAVLAPIAEAAEDLLERTFPSGAVTRLHGLLSEVPELRDTRDCLVLTDRILRMLEEEAAKEDAGNGSSGQDASSGPDGNPAPEPAGPGGEPPSQAGPGNPEDGAPEEDAGIGQSGQPGNGAPAEPAGDPRASALRQALSAGEGDLSPDLFERAKDLLHDDHPASAARLPSADEPVDNVQAGRSLLGQTATLSGGLRAALQGLVQASRRERPVPKAAGSRLRSGRLHRLAAGDPKVFERRWDKPAPNAALHILVDRSGSMMDGVVHDGVWVGQRADLAWSATMALALALDGIPGVNHAVTAFPGPSGHGDRVFKVMDHGQRTRQRMGRFGLRPGYNCSTPMAEALWYAAARLLACREPRKVILVMTDGEPDDRLAALEIIRRCETAGIEVVGVGLGLSVDRLFSRSVTVMQLGELRQRLFELTRELLAA